MVLLIVIYSPVFKCQEVSGPSALADMNERNIKTKKNNGTKRPRFRRILPEDLFIADSEGFFNNHNRQPVDYRIKKPALFAIKSVTFNCEFIFALRTDKNIQQ